MFLLVEIFYIYIYGACLKLSIEKDRCIKNSNREKFEK